jgi:hypothetical protein
VTRRRLLLLLAATAAVGTTVAHAASLSLGSGHLWAGSQTLTKATCTLQGTSSTTDTYVDEQSATTSFGGATTLSVGPKSSKRTWALVRFDLSSCNIPSSGGADLAKLNLMITAGPSSTQTLDVTTVLSSWSGATTWNVAQTLTLGSKLASFATGTGNGVAKTVTVTADVDALIKNGSANYGWLISEPSSQANTFALFGAAENAIAANQPQLVINYEK